MIRFTYDDQELPEETPELLLPDDAGEDGEAPLGPEDHGDHDLGADDEEGGLDDAPSRELPIGEELRELATAHDDGDQRALDTGADDVDFEDKAGEDGNGLDGMPDANVELGELPADEDGGAEGTDEDPAAEVDEDKLPPTGEGDDDGEGPA